MTTDTDALIQTVRDAMNQGNIYDTEAGNAALDSLAAELREAKALHAQFGHPEALLDRAEVAEANAEYHQRAAAQQFQFVKELTAELERVKAERDEWHAEQQKTLAAWQPEYTGRLKAEARLDKALAALREMAEAREDNGVDGSRLLYGSAAADRAHRCLAEIEGEA